MVAIVNGIPLHFSEPALYSMGPMLQLRVLLSHRSLSEIRVRSRIAKTP